MYCLRKICGWWQLHHTDKWGMTIVDASAQTGQEMLEKLDKIAQHWEPYLAKPSIINQ
jgi:hypothetical protein